MTEYDEMANKHVIIDKELAKVKRSSKSKINTDKEVIDTLKKERDSFRKKMEAKKEKNRLAKIDIKEERKIQSQYMA
jgi:predicted phage tail protein